MKTSKSSGAFRPFKELKELLEKKSLKSAPSPVGHAEKQVLKTCDSEADTPEYIEGRGLRIIEP